MEELSFTRCAVDHTLFIYDQAHPSRIICLISWHVNDGMGMSNSRPFLLWVKGKIAQCFGIKDLSPVTHFLGMQFKRDRLTHQLWIHQSKYITYLFEEHGLLNCNPVQLPLNPNHPFGQPSDTYPAIPNLQSQYRKIVGELLYLTICTCPDIAFAVNSLAQWNSNPSLAHYAAAKRLLRYLCGTINLRLYYGGDCIYDTLHMYCDTDLANTPDDHLSISRYAWFFAGGLITFVSKKQNMHVLSSTKAKYMAITHIIQEGLWLKLLFKELHLPVLLPIMIYMDNTGAISLSKEAKHHARSKHINVQYHFICEHIESNTFLPKWLPSHNNTADILMKALAHPLFLKHVNGLQLVSR
jgi:hypothetical protein